MLFLNPSPQYHLFKGFCPSPVSSNFYTLLTFLHAEETSSTKDLSLGSHITHDLFIPFLRLPLRSGVWSKLRSSSRSALVENLSARWWRFVTERNLQKDITWTGRHNIWWSDIADGKSMQIWLRCDSDLRSIEDCSALTSSSPQT